MKRIKRIAFAAAILLTAFFLLKNAQDAMDGARAGLEMCARTVIASLFPFMILSETAQLSGIFGKGRIARAVSRLTGLGECAAGCILFAFIGGYPVGLRLIKREYESGGLSREDAKKMTVFCVNAGPGFIVNTVGAGIFGSAKAGAAVLFATAVASLTAAAFTLIFSRKKHAAQKNVQSAALPAPDAFVTAVSSSVSGILSVCGWIILFSALRGVLNGYITNPAISNAVRMIAEVTDGAEAAGRIGGIPLCSAAVSFGGICVAMQLYPSLRAIGVNLGYYLLSRSVCALLSFIIASVTSRLFVPAVSISAFAPAAAGFSPSVPCSAMLLIAAGIIVIGEMKGDKT